MTKQSVFLLVTSLMLANISQATEFNLEKYRWQNRPLLVFTPSEQHPAYQQTLAAIEREQPDFADRDMVLLTALANEAEPLRNRYRIAANEFRILLIGKDGGVKLESAEAADMDEIFRLIDGMPMRQREMRETNYLKSNA